MNLKRIILYVVIGLAVVASLTFFILRLLRGSGTLNVWTPQGNEAAVERVAQIFHKQHPNYKVKIIPVPEQVYEFRSLFALASHTGPNVWIIPNEWMTLHRNKLQSAPDGVLDTALQSYTRTRPKEETPPPVPPKGRTNTDIMKQDYAPAIQADLVTDNKVWGVPLNLDTLALFYDRTQINPAPKTWKDVIDETRRFTIVDKGRLVRSTMALGDTDSIDHSADIVSILMLQNGTQMVDAKSGLATFNVSRTGSTPPGTNAIDFYTSFTRPDKETYSWDKSLGSSLTALKNGKTLMGVGYLSDLDPVGPISTTRIGVAPLPQVDPTQPMSYGRYLTATVTKQNTTPKMTQAAWQFASLFANPDISEQYALDLRTVPARKDVAARMTLGPQYVPFLKQVPLAVNWQKKEVAVADKTFRDAINSILKDNLKPQVALDVAGKSYTEFLQTESGMETDPQVMSFWQSTEDPNDYRTIITDFLRNSKTLKRIAISKHTPKRYEWEVLNAMAAWLGPDILLLPNDQINRWSPTLRSFPKGYFNVSGGRVNDVLAIEREFAPAVLTDNVINGKVYAMPVAFETLELAYNRQMYRTIDQENRDHPTKLFQQYQQLFRGGPLVWEQLKQMAQVAVKRTGNTVDRPFVALGTGSNVAHAQDIFAALVKQFGGELTDPDRLVAGIHLPKEGVVPGQEAEDLIKGFSNPNSPFYTWNSTQPNSLDAFRDGKVMSVFAYPSDLKKIVTENPFLEIGTFPFPQLNNTGDAVDYAHYFSVAIPKSGKLPDSAISFLHGGIFNDNIGFFLPPLLHREKPKILDRPNHASPQSIQIDSAQSYYKGSFPDEVDKAIIDMLDSRLTLEQAAQRINQSLKRKVL